MRILFLHPNFPAQFRHIATALAKDPQHQVVFGTKRAEGSIPGVHKAIYSVSRSVHPQTHHYVRSLESAVLEGQAVYRMGQTLKAQGFIPDVVYGHSGWGATLFIKDLFPQAKLYGYFEWFYHAHGSDADFDPSDPLDAKCGSLDSSKKCPDSDGFSKLRSRHFPDSLATTTVSRRVSCQTQGASRRH